jgi:predicted nucleotidyltransferase component of viral defense system
MFKLEQIKKAMPEATFELFTEGFADIDYMSKWTLVGGTALSIHLQHRLSEDLDFFIDKSTLDQERRHIEKMIRELEDKG